MPDTIMENDVLKELDNIRDQIYLLDMDFTDCKIYTFEGAEAYLNEYDERRKNIAERLSNVEDAINKIKDETVGESLYGEWDTVNASFLSTHQNLYTSLNGIYLSKMSEQIKKTNTKLENTLGTQFGIFSALLSLLAFILNNTKLFAIEGLTFNHVIIINLCYLLACTVIFYFVFCFIKPYYHSSGRVWSLVFVIGLLIGIIAFCYLKFPNIPIVPLDTPQS